MFFPSKASSHLWKLVDANQPEDKLLRVVTCLANIVCNSSIGIGVRRQAPTPTSDKTTFLNGASVPGGTSLISQQYVKFVFIRNFGETFTLQGRKRTCILIRKEPYVGKHLTPWGDTFRKKFRGGQILGKIFRGGR